MATAPSRRWAVGPGPAGTTDWATVALGIAAVGWVDWITGTGIRVLALYFMPLAWAGWRLKWPGALLGSVAATAVWTLAQYEGGVRHENSAIWIINLFTQGAAFITVGGLVAALAQRLQAEEALSRTDALTGLHNRRGLAEHAGLLLALCRRHAHAVSLACIDLDHFKQANDRLGHAAGDQVLAACAEVLSSSLRSTDLVARTGGDEFLVLLPETPLEAAVTLMERVRQAIEAQARIRTAGVTATIGVITDEPSTLSLDALMARADAHLYQGKKAGRNRVFAEALGPPEAPAAPAPGEAPAAR